MNLRLFSSVSFLLLAGVSFCAAQETAPVAPESAAASTPASLSAEQVVAELGRQLSDHYQVRGDLKVSLVRPWVAPAPVAGGYELSVVDCPARFTSSLLVRVRLMNGDRSCGDAVLPVQVQLFRNVFVARALVERDASFDPAQLDVRRVDVLRERDAVATDECEGDFTYTTSVQPGRLLVWRDLTKRALVHKGEVIEVAAVDGTMTVTTQAIAMENGAAGDLIKVRNLTSRKDFSAYVVAEARAQVRF